MHRAKRRDANEDAIVSVLESVGASVLRLNEPGAPDLLISFSNVLHLVEVKNPDAKGGGKYNTGDGALTATQTKWWARWRGKRPVIVQNAEEALRAIGAIR